MTNTTLIIVPRLGRNDRVGIFLESLTDSTRLPYEVVFVISRKQDHVKTEYTELFSVKQGWAAKCNKAAAKFSEFSHVFCAADDLKFHAGWLEELHDKLEDKVEVVSPNDLLNPWVMKGLHVTHPFVTRHYINHYGTIDKKGVLFHEYPHEYVDNEFSMTAIARGKFAYAEKAITEHMHPIVNKAEWDWTYQVGKNLHDESELMFKRRYPRILRKLKEEGNPWPGYDELQNPKS